MSAQQRELQTRSVQARAAEATALEIDRYVKQSYRVDTPRTDGDRKELTGRMDGWARWMDGWSRLSQHFEEVQGENTLRMQEMQGKIAFFDQKTAEYKAQREAFKVRTTRFGFGERR